MLEIKAAINRRRGHASEDREARQARIGGGRGVIKTQKYFHFAFPFLLDDTGLMIECCIVLKKCANSVNLALLMEGFPAFMFRLS